MKQIFRKRMNRMRFLFRSVLLRWSKIERERWAGIDNDYTNVFRVTGDVFIRGSIRNIVKGKWLLSFSWSFGWKIAQLSGNDGQFVIHWIYCLIYFRVMNGWKSYSIFTSMEEFYYPFRSDVSLNCYITKFLNGRRIFRNGKKYKIDCI